MVWSRRKKDNATSSSHINVSNNLMGVVKGFEANNQRFLSSIVSNGNNMYPLKQDHLEAVVNPMIDEIESRRVELLKIIDDTPLVLEEMRIALENKEELVKDVKKESIFTGFKNIFSSCRR